MAGKTFPAFLAHAQHAIVRICYEARDRGRSIVSLGFTEFSCCLYFRSNVLFHTSGHEVQCPIPTSVVPRFSGGLIGYTTRSKSNQFEDVLLAASEDFAPTHESANERKIFVNCLNDETCGNIMVIHQTVRHWLANKTFKFCNIPQFHRFRSIQFHIVLPDINIQQKYDFLINVHKRFGYSFQGWNMLNICRARGDGHHYDVTNKRYCVTRVASLAERAMAFSEYALVKNGKISKNCQYSHKYSAG